jgi:hypothetical protein
MVSIYKELKNTTDVSRETTIFQLQAELATFFMCYHIWKMTENQTIIMHTWVYKRHFLKIEQSKSVTLSKTADSSCCQ